MGNVNPQPFGRGLQIMKFVHFLSTLFVIGKYTENFFFGGGGDILCFVWVIIGGIFRGEGNFSGAKCLHWGGFDRIPIRNYFYLSRSLCQLNFKRGDVPGNFLGSIVRVLGFQGKIFDGR